MRLPAGALHIQVNNNKKKKTEARSAGIISSRSAREEILNSAERMHCTVHSPRAEPEPEARLAYSYYSDRRMLDWSMHMMRALNSPANYPAASSATPHEFTALAFNSPWRHSGSFCSRYLYPRTRPAQSSAHASAPTPPLHSHSRGGASERRAGGAAMEARRTARALLASFVLAALATQAFVAVVESRAEKASQGTYMHLLELFCNCNINHANEHAQATT